MASQVGGNWVSYANWNWCHFWSLWSGTHKLCRGNRFIRKDGFGQGITQFFLKEKNKRGVPYRIIPYFSLNGLLFSVLLITNGDVKLLGRVYTISFLSVMGAFSEIGTLLKVRRKQIASTRKSKLGLQYFIAYHRSDYCLAEIVLNELC